MATKAEEMDMATRGHGCLGKAANDEPIFVLRAQDRFAPDVVEQWITFVETKNAGVRTTKTEEARVLVRRMREWQRDHSRRVKVPD